MILHDKEIEVFKVVATKAIDERFAEELTILGGEWEVLRNNKGGKEGKESIWLVYRKKSVENRYFKITLVAGAFLNE